MVNYIKGIGSIPHRKHQHQHLTQQNPQDSSSALKVLEVDCRNLFFRSVSPLGTYLATVTKSRGR